VTNNVLGKIVQGHCHKLRLVHIASAAMESPALVLITGKQPKGEVKAMRPYDNGGRDIPIDSDACYEIVASEEEI
jgi:hypothetical protein